MRRTKFSLGLWLALLGIAFVVIGGIWRPRQSVPYAQWKNRIAPVHLAWMGGLALCTGGILLLLLDTLSWKADDREITNLRERILNALSRTGTSQQQLNDIITARYSKAGLLSLNTTELGEILSLLEARDDHQI
jgi:hypothetical protein